LRVAVVKNILDANSRIAQENRKLFDKLGLTVINLMSSPGAGKTTLLEQMGKHFGGQLKIGVIEGDIQTTLDAERVAAAGLEAVQIETDGACHLDANMIAAAIDGADYADVDMLFIENVGNLVCTAGYDLGEHVRIVVLSTSEGDDKATKYPAIFQGSDAMVITKTDLKPHLNFNTDRITADLKRLQPDAAVFEVAALQGQGISDAADWLLAKRPHRK